MNEYNYIIDGNNCSTKLELMKEIAIQLNFPDYFGHNWDSLEEVINDPEWFGKYDKVTITIVDANKILPSYHGFVDKVLGMFNFNEDNEDTGFKSLFQILEKAESNLKLLYNKILVVEYKDEQMECLLKRIKKAKS